MFGMVFYVNLCLLNLAWIPNTNQNPVAIAREQQAPSRSVFDEFSAIEAPAASPGATNLRAPYPNPFNAGTTIEFTVEQERLVHLSILDLRGRMVCSLVSAVIPAGSFDATWNGLDMQGNPVPSGVYFCRLSSGAASTTRRMTLLK